jgi:hypothetical protein
MKKKLTFGQLFDISINLKISQVNNTLRAQLKLNYSGHSFMYRIENKEFAIDFITNNTKSIAFSSIIVYTIIGKDFKQYIVIDENVKGIKALVLKSLFNRYIKEKIKEQESK